MTGRACKPPSPRRKQHGISLVEVLVTLVATSTGLLGIAALQLVSLRSNELAHERMQASSLAVSMLDRIRANRAAFLAGEYDAIDFDKLGNPGARSGADLQAWQTQIDNSLPGPDDYIGGAIQRTPSSNLITVTVRWGPRPAGSTESVNALQITTEM